jgi:hypothetical protein
MPNAPEHFMSARDLKYLPIYLFGTEDVPDRMIKNVNKWMDGPVRPVSEGGMLGLIIREGEFAGQKILPNTHRAIHHNSFDVARVFGGGHDAHPEAFNPALIHNQLDYNHFDRWLLSNGLPGSAQFGAAGLMMAIGKGLGSAFSNFAKVKSGEIDTRTAIVNVASDCRISTIEGIAKLATGAAIHNSVLMTGSEVLKNISTGGGALVAGYTVCELGKDFYKFTKGELSGSDLTINTVTNITKSSVGLYTAKIGAIIGAHVGPLGMALGGMIGGVVGGILVDQVITTVIHDLRMKPEDFIKPISGEDLIFVNSLMYKMYVIEDFRRSVNQFVDDFTETDAFQQILFDVQKRLISKSSTSLLD